MMHSTYDYILDPQHKITVALIGCGGTGSQVLSILARMNLSLIALGHLGLHVTAYDADEVSEANIGRQLFSDAEIGLNKANALITKFNRAFGTNWAAIQDNFSKKNYANHNIYITCVDDFETRLKIGKLITNTRTAGDHEEDKFYWLDFGNSNDSGQMIMGTIKKTSVPMQCFTDWAQVYKAPKKSINVPSCSLAEALEKQDLLINSSLANAGMQLLWRIFRTGKTPYRGIMLNLDHLILNPIPV